MIKRKFACDFETTTDPDDCRVWAYGIAEIGSTSVIIGDSLDEFMRLIFAWGSNTYYFHNLRFDGSFIINWLLNNNFTFVLDRGNKMQHKQFTCLIDLTNTWYNVEIKYKKYIIKIYDSLKLIPLSIDQMPKAFGLKINKLELDYTTQRDQAHKITEREREYLKNDVIILSMSLKTMFDFGVTKLTIGSSALSNYKETIKKHFDKWFPVLPPDVDQFIRKSYKGGYVYCNPRYQDKILGEGIIIDVHSMYPGVLVNEMLPYDHPVYFKGKYVLDLNYPLYVQRIMCQFELKKNMLPTIQIKNHSRFAPTDYLESSDGELIELTLTNIDLDIFLSHYNVYNITYLDGYKMRGSTNMFNDYVNYWYKQKVHAKKDGNAGLMTISKLMLNSLTGKYGTSGTAYQKIPKLIDNKLNLSDKIKNEKATIYVPLISFVTAYGRRKTISSAQDNIDSYIYSDTDSCHFLATKLQNVTITDNDLYTWGVEHTFSRAKYLRSKTYVFEENGKIVVKCAGLPLVARDAINFDNFKVGSTFSGKLRPVQVKGGVILKDTPYKIKGH